MRSHRRPGGPGRRGFGAPGVLAVVLLLAASGVAGWLAVAPPGGSVVLTLDLPTDATVELEEPTAGTSEPAALLESETSVFVAAIPPAPEATPLPDPGSTLAAITPPLGGEPVALTAAEPAAEIESLAGGNGGPRVEPARPAVATIEADATAADTPTSTLFDAVEATMAEMETTPTAATERDADFSPAAAPLVLPEDAPPDSGSDGTATIISAPESGTLVVALSEPDPTPPDTPTSLTEPEPAPSVTADAALPKTPELDAELAPVLAAAAYSQSATYFAPIEAPEPAPAPATVSPAPPGEDAPISHTILAAATVTDTPLPTEPAPEPDLTPVGAAAAILAPAPGSASPAGLLPEPAVPAETNIIFAGPPGSGQKGVDASRTIAADGKAGIALLPDEETGPALETAVEIAKASSRRNGELILSATLEPPFANEPAVAAASGLVPAPLPVMPELVPVPKSATAPLAPPEPPLALDPDSKPTAVAATAVPPTGGATGSAAAASLLAAVDLADSDRDVLSEIAAVAPAAGSSDGSEAFGTDGEVFDAGGMRPPEIATVAPDTRPGAEPAVGSALAAAESTDEIATLTPSTPATAVAALEPGKDPTEPPDGGRGVRDTEPPAPATGGGVRETWLAYARPFADVGGRPLVAVVVTGLGLSQAATTAAIRLPGEVTLGFSSYARNLQGWIDLARASGHEVLLDLPMEPVNYPAIDPGPQALLTSLPASKNIERLRWHLGRAVGYIGVTHHMGSRFTASPDDLRPILSALRVRGLMFLDARTSSHSVGAKLAAEIGLPRAANDRFIDAHASRSAIDQRLGEIERIAHRRGHSVTIGQAFPVTLDRLDEWLPTLADKGLALAPLSALANKQTFR